SDHRLVYLTYEGPISGGRGRVQIADRGTYSASVVEGEVRVVRLDGRRTRGKFRLEPLEGSLCRLLRVAES
ncbi:MAG: hypothetical protein HQ546_00840, partial [Planctomycetes bacterium]|nr:hypothetical protein [Planctomycetota bacterium]